MLSQNRGFTVVAVLTLALGIGATTTIFSVINAVLLRPPAYKDVERLVMIWQKESMHDWGPFVGVSFPNFTDFKKQSDSFDAMEVSGNNAYYVQDGGEPEMVFGKRVTAGFLPLLGVSPLLGRGFSPEENRAAAGGVVLLSHGYWKIRFGGDRQIVGKTIRVNGRPCTVVGVLPPNLQFPAWGAEPKIVVPLDVDAKQQTFRGWRSFNVVGRLKPGATLQQAHTQLDTIAERLDKLYPINNSGVRTKVLPVSEQIVVEIRPVLLLLLAAVGSVLLIACANVANLLLARASGRGKEMAIRAALGAGRGRMIRQLLTESTLLALLGGLLGVAIAYAAVEVLLRLSPDFIPRVKEISVNLPVLGFALLVSFGTGIVFGLVPAIHSARIDLTETLKENGRGSTGGLTRSRGRSLLVVGEVALAVILLVSAGLLIRSLGRLLEVDPGFDTGHLLVAQICLPDTRYQALGEQNRFYENLLGRLRNLPGIKDAALIDAPPLTGGDLGSDIMTEDDLKPWTNAQPHPAHRSISTNYFQVMGIPLLRGRGLTRSEVDGAPKVVVVSETMAKQLWPHKDAIGQRLTYWYRTNGPTEWLSVVGITADVRMAALDIKPKMTMYASFLQDTNTAGHRYMSVVLRTKVDPWSLASTVRQRIRALDKDVPIEDITTMDRIISKAALQRRFNMRILMLFAAVALALAAVGIYGVMAYSVSQRSQEIGIRMTLGAQAGDILRLIVRHGMKLVLAGLTIGIVAALGFTRFLTSQLYEVKSADPATFLCVILILSGVGFVACFLPARRATNVDPLVAMRSGAAGDNSSKTVLPN